MIGVTAVAFGLTMVSGQTAGGQGSSAPVIYKECSRPPLRRVIGRFPECGVDEASTAEFRRQIEESTRVPTPEENRQVEQRIEEQYVRPQAEERRSELLAVLQNARQRIISLLGSKTLPFTADERAFLRAQADWIGAEAARLAATPPSSIDAQTLRQELAEKLGRVQAVVVARQREAAVRLPTIENIITRIDDLVIRVGTVLRELERDGVKVPPEVTEGYLTAKIYLTDAKKTCSLRRPASCRLLADALDEIAKMREPLCALPSERLTFCR